MIWRWRSSTFLLRRFPSLRRVMFSFVLRDSLQNRSDRTLRVPSYFRSRSRSASLMRSIAEFGVRMTASCRDWSIPLTLEKKPLLMRPLLLAEPLELRLWSAPLLTSCRRGAAFRGRFPRASRRFNSALLRLALERETTGRATFFGIPARQHGKRTGFWPRGCLQSLIRCHRKSPCPGRMPRPLLETHLHPPEGLSCCDDLYHGLVRGEEGEADGGGADGHRRSQLRLGRQCADVGDVLQDFPVGANQQARFGPHESSHREHGTRHDLVRRLVEQLAGLSPRRAWPHLIVFSVIVQRALQFPPFHFPCMAEEAFGRRYPPCHKVSCRVAVVELLRLVDRRDGRSTEPPGKGKVVLVSSGEEHRPLRRESFELLLRLPRGVEGAHGLLEDALGDTHVLGPDVLGAVVIGVHSPDGSRAPGKYPRSVHRESPVPALQQGLPQADGGSRHV